jgi:hypothetical protein
MIIKGEYHDVLCRDGAPVHDSGWRSNTIVQDCGKFLAALMKKEFGETVGVEYMAVGSGSAGPGEFKTKIASFFQSGSLDAPYTAPGGTDWVWAKKISVDDIKFLTPGGDVTTSATNRIKVEVTFLEEEPSRETLVFKEFALLGVNSALASDRLFLINHVSHGPITKDKSMKLTRTVRLTFPIETP